MFALLTDHSTTMYRSLAPVNEAALSRNQSHKQQVTSKNTSEQSKYIYILIEVLFLIFVGMGCYIGKISNLYLA